jgi:hypothetical protein
VKGRRKELFFGMLFLKKVEQRKHLVTFSNGSAEANFYVTIK